jgi:surfactin synthase thioesterase subunit
LPDPKWWLCRAKRPAAALRLYCFPHSGGSPGEFLRWADRLPEAEVWALQLPGRGRRFAEPACTDLAELVSTLVRVSTLRAPFAFFGHSLGALVAFETTRELRARGLQQPVRLFASAYPAPDLPDQRQPVAGLSDEELLESVSGEYGDTFGTVRDDPELLAGSLAAFRADFSMLDGYKHVAAAPLDLPVTVLGGREDDIEAGELAAWRSQCAGDFDLRIFPGGHFYFRERPAELLGCIRDTLAGSRD